MSDRIDRKFLLEELPPTLSLRKKETIRLAFLDLREGKRIRIRQKGKHFDQTVKISSGHGAKAFKTDLTKHQFLKIWYESRGCRLSKTRYHGLWEGRRIIIDQFNGILKGLFTAKLALDRSKISESFSLPGFLREEITFDPRYKSSYLALMRKEQKKSILASGILQSLIGAIPYIKDGPEKKVILVTKRKEKQWIFPKGQQERKMPYPDVARMEAEEEAGIRGKITGAPIRIPYEQPGFPLNLLAFPLEVDQILQNWQEDQERQRVIVSVPEAYSLSDRLSVHCGLQYLEKVL